MDLVYVHSTVHITRRNKWCVLCEFLDLRYESKFCAFRTDLVKLTALTIKQCSYCVISMVQNKKYIHISEWDQHFVCFQGKTFKFLPDLYCRWLFELKLHNLGQFTFFSHCGFLAIYSVNILFIKQLIFSSDSVYFGIFFLSARYVFYTN